MNLKQYLLHKKGFTVRLSCLDAEHFGFFIVYFCGKMCYTSFKVKSLKVLLQKFQHNILETSLIVTVLVAKYTRLKNVWIWKAEARLSFSHKTADNSGMPAGNSKNA